MSINPAKALAAHRVLEKHGLPPKQEQSKPREYMPKDKAIEVIEDLKRPRQYRSKIDEQNRRSWRC
jgi:hypothetical protein